MVGWRASTNCMLWVIGNFCNAIRLLSVREGFPACALWSARTMSRSTSADVMMVQTKLIFFIDLPSSRDELSLNRLFLYSQECTSDAGVLSVNLSALWNSRMEFAFFFLPTILWQFKPQRRGPYMVPMPNLLKVPKICARFLHAAQPAVR